MAVFAWHGPVYIYELTLKHVKRTSARVCVLFLAKNMPTIDNFIIVAGHFEFLYSHWRTTN